MIENDNLSKNKPDDVTVGAWIKFLRLERHLLNALAKNLRQAGLPPLIWYDVLWELEKAPDYKLHPSQIEEQMLLNQYNVSRLIDRLVAKEYVIRQSCGGDKRRQWVVVTEQGRKLRQKMWPVYAAAIQQHFAQHLSGAELRLLHATFDKLLAFTNN